MQPGATFSSPWHSHHPAGPPCRTRGSPVPSVAHAPWTVDSTALHSPGSSPTIAANPVGHLENDKDSARQREAAEWRSYAGFPSPWVAGYSLKKPGAGGPERLGHEPLSLSQGWTEGRKRVVLTPRQAQRRGGTQDVEEAAPGRGTTAPVKAGLFADAATRGQSRDPGQSLPWLIAPRVSFWLLSRVAGRGVGRDHQHHGASMFVQRAACDWHTEGD